MVLGHHKDKKIKSILCWTTIGFLAGTFGIFLLGILLLTLYLLLFTKEYLYGQPTGSAVIPLISNIVKITVIPFTLIGGLYGGLKKH